MIMVRSFKEERQQQLIEEELEETIDKVFPDKLREHYSQNPLLALLLRPGRKKKVAPHADPQTRIVRPAFGRRD